MASKSNLGLVMFMMITIVLLLLSLAAPSFSSSSNSSSHAAGTSKGIGFTVDLIHSIYSPQSPFYNPSLTDLERTQESIDQSYSRYHHFSRKFKLSSSFNTNFIDAPMKPLHDRFGGQYIISYLIGTPPIRTFALVDTGSEITWLQCLPCIECFPQHTTIYDPTKSSTYAIVKCDDTSIKNCSSSHISQCRKQDNTCGYQADYVNGAKTQGDLATETLTFGVNTHPRGEIALNNIPIGCGHTNEFRYGHMPPGMIGLDRGPLSFISNFLEDHKFSYCLLPVDKDRRKETSKIHFGSDALLVGEKTPLIINPKYPEGYYLNLEGISVDNEKIQIPPGTFNITPDGNGGLVIDSGTTLTFLHRDAFYPLIKAIDQKTGLTGKQTYLRFELCYWSHLDEILHKAPNVTFHFTGVDLELSKENTWMKLKDGWFSGELWCLSIQKNLDGEEYSLLGNRLTRNVNVGYDLENNALSFKYIDCTRTV